MIYDRIHNQDCIEGSREHIKDEEIHLMLCDPPFGINETTFDKHYARNEDLLIDGYVEAPEDYALFTYEWMKEAKRVLHPDGSMFVIMGHTMLRHVLNVAASLGLEEINHIVWKYNFGVNTTRKFVTSHYHVLLYAKPKANRTFNLTCRHGKHERHKGGSVLFRDLEDVFTINRDYSPNKKRNKNKLPDELIRKLILYCSNEGDNVCDFFQGNFTTAIMSKTLGRVPIGFEKNKEAYDCGMQRIKEVKKEKLKIVESIEPENQGKPISQVERDNIIQDFKLMYETKSMTKKDIVANIGEKYGRGKFSIINILKRYEDASC